jgi:hypothetical protein
MRVSSDFFSVESSGRVGRAGIMVDHIDMKIVSRPPHPHLRFPFCADCAPFELVLSAALL